MARRVWNNPKLRPMVIARYKTFDAYWKSCQYFNDMTDLAQKEFEARTYENLVAELVGRPKKFQERVLSALRRANNRGLNVKGL
jgi:hypothetical protein